MASICTINSIVASNHTLSMNVWNRTYYIGLLYTGIPHAFSSKVNILNDI